VTDSFGTNRLGVSVTYTMKCVPSVPVTTSFSLSLTNRCHATMHAVMLLPKHFNELTWPYVSCRILYSRCYRHDYGIIWRAWLFWEVSTLKNTSRFIAYVIHSRTKNFRKSFFIIANLIFLSLSPVNYISRNIYKLWIQFVIACYIRFAQ